MYTRPSMNTDAGTWKREDSERRQRCLDADRRQGCGYGVVLAVVRAALLGAALGYTAGVLRLGR